MKTHLQIIGCIAALIAVGLWAEDRAGIKPTEIPISITASGVKSYVAPSTTMLRVTEIQNPIFQLRGIPQLQASASNSSFASILPTYCRPEKPEEVTVELWTKDGKHWVAKWEEAK